MTSFIVTVIGEKPDQQMLKYSSFSSEDNPNPHIQIINEIEQIKSSFSDVDGISLNDFLKRHCYYNSINELKKQQNPDFYNDHINGYFVTDETGNIEAIFERKNPNDECYKFTLGGGWAGFYYLKDGHTGIAVGTPRRGTPAVRPNTADMVRKGDIDFERMMKEGGEAAAKRYDAFYALAAKHNNNLDDSFDTEFELEQQKGTFPMMSSIYDYDHDRDVFIRLRELLEISSYAFIKDGIINKKPESIGPLPIKEQIAWLESIWQDLFSLPNDTLFTLYECYC